MDWRKQLSAKQRTALALADQAMKTNELGGSVVPQTLAPWSTMRRMATLLDAEPDPRPSSGRVLIDVPYHSQWDPDAKGKTMDCGAAAAEIVGEHFVPENDDVTTDEIYHYMTKGDNRGTYLWELSKAMVHFYGFKLNDANLSDYSWLRTHLDQGRPIIILVRYGNYTMRMDRSYVGGHWMVVVGYDHYQHEGLSIPRFYLHDPDFWGDDAQGAEVCITQTLLQKMQAPYNYLAGIPDYAT